MLTTITEFIIMHVRYNLRGLKQMKSKVTVPAEIIKNIQRDFDLDNTELATLFGVSLRTVQSWLQEGICGERGNSVAMVNLLLIMKRLSENDPDDFVPFDLLKKIVKNAVSDPKLIYYTLREHRGVLGPALGIFDHHGIIPALATVMYSLYLNKKGKDVVFEEDPETYKKMLYAV